MYACMYYMGTIEPEHVRQVINSVDGKKYKIFMDTTFTVIIENTPENYTRYNCFICRKAFCYQLNNMYIDGYKSS